jgi:hypothetical protein
MITKMMVKFFLKMDNNQHVPFLMRFYMIISPTCRCEIYRIQDCLTVLKNDAPYHSQRDITKKVMKVVEKESITIKQKVSNLNWAFAGIVLFSGFFALSFSEYFQGLKEQFGDSIEIYLYGVFGIAITVYAAMFIASHIGAFKKHQ